MTETEEIPGAGASDEIHPYKIHVSSKYLQLTRQKLELTRLPHEGGGAEPAGDGANASRDWWEPKPQVEPLIDYWLEKYSWREQEDILNKTPQFRTSIPLPHGSPAAAPVRLHFIHARSPHADLALPLLLLPPFPLSNLALTHLVGLFTRPEEHGPHQQPFHLVIPALPGLGFSDPFPGDTPDEIPAAAGMLDALMARLGYAHYLVSNAGAAHASPGNIDWRLIEHLATRHAGSCLGAHFVAPPLASPRLAQAPVEWAKWRIASALHAGILGYSAQDFSALREAPAAKTQGKKGFTPSKLGLNHVGLREPNTLAYAMCDSPTGLLVFAMKGLSLLGPRKKLTPEQIITITNLAWLPGPEYAMRFWAHCASDNKTKAVGSKPNTSKPKVAITVFLGGEVEEADDAGAAQRAGEDAIRLEAPMKSETGAGYACPAWGKTHYKVLFSQRVAGDPGLLAWERPEVILTGVRGLAKEILKVDKRLLPAPEVPTAPLENVVVPGETEAPAARDDGLEPPARPLLEQGDSSRTQVASQSPSSPKGKEVQAEAEGKATSPAGPEATDVVADSKGKTDEDHDGETESPRGETPDTVVLVTAPTPTTTGEQSLR